MSEDVISTRSQAVCTFRYKVTGKERDAESGLDYFGTRYYGSSMGRFMSPDPSGLAYSSLANPQSLNLYSYALNNPLKNTDPTGLYCYYGDSNSTSDGFDINQYDFHSSSGECTAQDENGNSGQWINDAQTHQNSDGSFADNEGRLQEAVSGQANAPISTLLTRFFQTSRCKIECRSGFSANSCGARV